MNAIVIQHVKVGDLPEDMANALAPPKRTLR